MEDFVHLHLHSEFSLLDGACRINEIPEMAKSLGQSAVAITDHGVMYGAVDFYKACKKAGVKPIIGCEVYVAPRSLRDKDRQYDTSPYHLVLLVKNEEGMKNLMYMESEAFLCGFYSKPRIDLELLENHTGGLIGMSACLAGYIPRKILSGEYEEAKNHALYMKSIFEEDSYYLEIQDHGIEDQKTVNASLFSLSKETGIPLVATNDIHYLRKSDAEIQALSMCIQTGNVITDGRPIGFETDEFYFKSREEMERLFPEHKEALDNTVKIADMCSFEFDFSKTYLPQYIPENNAAPSEYIKEIAYDGYEKRKKNKSIVFSEKHPESEYEERIKYELSVIESMGYSEYFLIVWDYVKYAKEKKIPVGPGRGSGAGSIVAYLMEITDVNPVEYELLFERFLNPERVSMPDFDIDFCYNRRYEVIEYIKEKYGADHTAQIITFGTMAARGAVRDVGRAMGVPYAQVDEIAKLIPQTPGVTLDEALENKNLKELYDSDFTVRQIINNARSLEGFPRHASKHAAAVVITRERVDSYVPLAYINGVTVTQYPMSNIEQLGLLKFDFLGLRYLTILDAAERQIKKKNEKFSLSSLPMDDEATYSMISQGKTDGVFQLESAGMKRMLTNLKPERFSDIIAAIALFRPGPMESIPRYIEARHGKKVSKYNLPVLDAILEDTYGCIVYQEQVMQIFRELAGYTLGQADMVRRAIAKKKLEIIENEREKFISGAAERGISQATSEGIFEDIVSFANYAFNKSHAAAYAVLSYRTAYLRRHYPLEYNCALLTSVMSWPSKISEYVYECENRGIKILPPDINKSYTEFTVEGDNIRFGLPAVKNLGEAFISKVIEEREKGGKFSDIDDFIFRIRKKELNKKQLEALIESGTLDSLGTYRSRLHCSVDRMMDGGDGNVSNNIEGQVDMFSQQDFARLTEKIEFPEIPEFTLKEKLKLEKMSIGMFLSGHLLDDYRKHIEYIAPDRAYDITASFEENDDAESGELYYKDKDVVTLCGIVSRVNVKKTKRGNVSFVVIEDYTSDIELICFSDVYAAFAHLLITDNAVSVKGTISARENEVKIIVRSVEMLIENKRFEEIQDKVKSLSADNKSQPVNVSVNVPVRNKKLYLRLDMTDGALMKKVEGLLGIFEGGVPVWYYDVSKKEYIKNTGISIEPRERLLNELILILGRESVVLK